MSCSRHSIRARSTDAALSACFSRAFVAIDNIRAVDDAKGTMNDDVRMRLRSVAASCVKSSNRPARDMALDWISLHDDELVV